LGLCGGVACVVGEKGSFEIPAGTVGDNPGKGETFSGSPVSDGGIWPRLPPGNQKSGEFRKNGTIRGFYCPIRAQIHFIHAGEKIRANIRYWAGDLCSNRLKWAEKKGRAVLGIGLTPEPTQPPSKKVHRPGAPRHWQISERDQAENL